MTYNNTEDVICKVWLITKEGLSKQPGELHQPFGFLCSRLNGNYEDHIMRKSLQITSLKSRIKKLYACMQKYPAQ